MRPARFITDFGSSTTFVVEGTGEVVELGRYGVWGDKGHWSGKAEVIEVGDDLDALQAKHGPGLPVHPLGGGSGGRVPRVTGS